MAVRSGLVGVEWGADHHVLPGDPDRARDVARRTSEAGLVNASYGSYLFVPKASPGAVEAVLDTAVALGAPNVRVWTDWVGPDPDPATRAAIVSQLASIAARAAERALTISLEFHPGTATETAASALDVLQEVDAPNLFTYWQPPTGLSVPDLLASWRAVRHRTSHLHVFRWHSYGDRQALADGADLWPAVLAEPPADERWPGDRFAFLEFVRGDDPDQLATDASVLRGWLASV
jgi:sugar phosphate isomerase/epimerase